MLLLRLLKISDAAISDRIYKFPWGVNLLDSPLFNAGDNVLFCFISAEHDAWCSRHLMTVCYIINSEKTK